MKFLILNGLLLPSILIFQEVFGAFKDPLLYRQESTYKSKFCPVEPQNSSDVPQKYGYPFLSIFLMSLA